MKKAPITYKLFVIFTSVLLMLSSVPFSANLHFCKGKLREISFSNNTNSCCKKLDISVSCKKNTQKNKRSGCCSNQTICSQHTQEAFFSGETQFHIQKLVTSSIIFSKYFYLPNNETITTQKEVSYLKYSPPRLTRNIIILVEQFLC